MTRKLQRVMLTLLIGMLAASTLMLLLVRWFEPRMAFFPEPGESENTC